MTTTTFDALAYFEKLKAAGVPEEQAKVQANAFRDFSAIQEENNRKELATKGDINDVRLEMKEIEMRLSERIEASKRETLKWLIALLLSQSALLVAVFAYLKP
ncbi:MAG: hypothetical protein K2H64_10930 [Desulfovibrio sp.]|nr:hypothetical protein [Desulfovibrio sp.]